MPAQAQLAQQSGNWTFPGSVGSIAATFPNQTTPGSLLVALFTATANVGAISDSSGNTWTRVGSVTGGYGTLQVWWCVNVNSFAVNTVTITASMSSPALQIMEFTGLDVTSPFGVFATNTGTSTTPNVNIASTSADALIIGFAIPTVVTDFINTVPPWLAVDAGASRNSAVYQPLSGLTYNVAFLQVNGSGVATSGAWGAAAISFKATAVMNGPASIPGVKGPTLDASPGDQVVDAAQWEFNTGIWRTTGTAPTGLLNYFVAVNFPLAIPSTATIKGIIVTAGYLSQSATTATIANVSLYNGGVAIGTAKAPATAFTTTRLLAKYGGSEDQWGNALTPAILNSSTFGFGLQANMQGVRLFLDRFTVTVFYEVDGVLTQAIWGPRPSAGCAAPPSGNDGVVFLG